MDTITTYREIIKEVISEYSRLKPSHGKIRLDVIFDETRDHYALMQVGWDKSRRVRGNLIYVIISNGKVIIEYDGIESGITKELINRGISSNDIKLGFIE
ncbi:MAG: XisI protein [Sphaerospermopsis sp. SIO1G2]|nr:XisI protein [Sphaerospermopsis sp. SIO1G1]NET69820.1 XisI protein [Sphaerospermopsis sp. SIO1G2]